MSRIHTNQETWFLGGVTRSLFYDCHIGGIDKSHRSSVIVDDFRYPSLFAKKSGEPGNRIVTSISKHQHFENLADGTSEQEFPERHFECTRSHACQIKEGIGMKASNKIAPYARFW